MVMNDQELRKLQLAELNILKVVAAICDKYGLKYYLAEGTLLGAVRHNGFIPWDDDIDLCMPREDLEKFSDIAAKELPKSYTCRFCHDTDVWGTMRISDENHKICRTLDGKVLNLFVSIDIFPLDGFPKSKCQKRLHWMHLLFRFAIFKFTQFDQIDREKDRSFISKLAIAVAASLPLGKWLDKQTELHKLTNVLKTYPYSSSEEVINFYSEYGIKDLGLPITIMPKEFFGRGKSTMFEDISCTIPDKADKVLEREYGDYMVLPPLEKQKPKHDISLCE